MLPFTKVALSNLFKKPSTVPFPKVNVDAKPNYRGRISYEADKCVNCGMCIKVCSPGAITRTVEPAEGGENITYTIDLTSCTFCGTCSDFCSTKAMTLTTDYHMVAEDASELRVTGTRFKEEIKGVVTMDPDKCIYCTLCARTCPEGAIKVDRASKTWEIDASECVKCGRCIEKCPKKALSFQAPKEEGILFGQGCVYCSKCAGQCPMGAITVDRPTKTWQIDREKCIKCGVCVNGCPMKCLSIGPLGEEPAKAAPAPAAAPVKAAPADTSASSAQEEGIVFGDGCVYCTKCARQCPVGAITVDRTAKTWEIDREKCVQCGACVDGCPKSCLSIGAVPASKAAESAPAPVKPAAEAPQAETAKADEPDDEDAVGIHCSDACVFCSLCARVCPVKAITVDRAARSWKIDRDICIQCQACLSNCPRNALSFKN